MQLYPAIDLKGGNCVRLRQGSFSDVKFYSGSPVDVASYWESLGATYLHIVDLDGALSGYRVNEAAIQNIRKAVKIPIELGGGIRDIGSVSKMLEAGITRVIIGTKALTDPLFLKEVIRNFGPEKIVAGVDAKNGMVAVEGWERVSSVRADELGLRLKEDGIRHIVYTDISRDGMMSGPNISSAADMTKETGLDVIVSGGISSLKDLDDLNRAGISGAIIGKALYEKKIDLSAAVKQFQ